MVIYADLVMGLNFLVDLLLFLGTNRLAGFPSQGGRLAAASALGAVYSGACLIPGFRFLGNVLWRTVSLAGMGIIAFGWERSAWKRSGVFLLLSMALGGMAVSIRRPHIPALLLAAGGMWLLCRVSFGEGVGSRSYVPLRIRYQGKQVLLTALQDSGNTLRDPLTGEPVIIIGPEAAHRLTGLTAQQLACPLETLASRPLPGLRLIPYQAVGQSGGMLLALRFSDVHIHSRHQSALVAFAPAGLGTGTYQALTGGI